MKRAIPVFGLLLLSGLLHAAHAQPAPPAPPPPGMDDPNRVDGHQSRPVAAFHGIDLAGVMTVEVTAGKPGAVELIGDADLFDKVSTTVKDGILVIDTRFPEHRSIHMRAMVSTSDLSSLTVSGTGAIKASNVASPTLALTLPGTGTGKIKVAGTAAVLRIDVAGTGNVSAKDLVARSAMVAMSGTGSATLDATDSVDATLSGTGSIDVHGHPAHVTKRNTGMGSIHIR